MRHFIIDTTLDSHVDKKDRWMCIQIQEIKVNVKRKSVKGIFQVHSFDDNGHHVIYMPALNLTAYGDNNEEASQMLDVIVEDFFDGLFTLSETDMVSELTNLGWKRNPMFQKDFTNVADVGRDGIFRNFNLSPETEIKSQLLAV